MKTLNHVSELSSINTDTANFILVLWKATNETYELHTLFINDRKNNFVEF